MQFFDIEKLKKLKKIIVLLMRLYVESHKERFIEISGTKKTLKRWFFFPAESLLI